MKKILAIALVGLLATSANAAMLSLVDMTGGPHQGSLSPMADPMVLNISETGVVGVQLEMFLTTGGSPEYVTGVNIFLDSVLMDGVGGFAEAVGSGHAQVYPGSEDFEVVDVTRAGDAGFIWTNARAYDVAPMDELEDGPLPFGSGIGLDEYYLVANMTPGDFLTGPGTYLLDSITIHGTSESTDTLWFENAYTFQPAIDGGLLRQQAVFRPDGGTLPLTASEGAASGGALGFYNGFYKLKPSGAVQWEKPGYWVNVVPEPASLALLALGGLALLRRR